MILFVALSRKYGRGTRGDDSLAVLNRSEIESKLVSSQSRDWKLRDSPPHARFSCDSAHVRRRTVTVAVEGYQEYPAWESELIRTLSDMRITVPHRQFLATDER